MIIDALNAECLTLTNPGGNYSINGYPTRIPTITPPSQATSGVTAAGDGVLPIGTPMGNYGVAHVTLIPIGVGSATNTFSMTILGWNRTQLNVANTSFLWIPVSLATIAVTLGTETGVANSELGTTTLFATTITMTGAAVGVTSGMAATVLDWFTISPGSNAIGCIRQPTFGFRFLEVIFTTGGSATSCNCLWRKG
jgi:hypothetical protein